MSDKTNKTTKTAIVITATRKDGSTESISETTDGTALTARSAVAACDVIAANPTDESNPIVRLNVTQGAKALHVVSLTPPVATPDPVVEPAKDDDEGFAAFEEARKSAKAAKAEAKKSGGKKAAKPRKKASFDPANIPAGLLAMMPARKNAIPRLARAAGIKAIRDARLVKDGKVVSINEAKYATLLEKVRGDHPKADGNIIAWCATAVNIGAYPVKFEAEGKKRSAAEAKAKKTTKADKAKAATKATKKAADKPAKKAAPVKKARKARKARKAAVAA